MPASHYTVATTAQLTGEGIRQLRWEVQRLERLKTAVDERQPSSSPRSNSTTDVRQPFSPPRPKPASLEILPALRFRETRRHSDERSTDLYFSPVEVSGADAGLSDPLPTPGPTTAQYRDVEEAWAAVSDAVPVRSSDGKSVDAKWMLRVEDLDRLVVALANAPMIQSHVQGETWDPSRQTIPDRPSFLSLRSKLRAFGARDSAVSLQSAAAFPTDGGRMDLQAAPQSFFAGLALMEPSLHAPKLSFWSRDHERDGRIRSDGKNHYLHLPFNSTSSFNCCLRVQPAASCSTAPSIAVYLQLTIPILVRKEGRKMYSMVAEVDVTQSFRKAAFAELVEQAGYDADSISLASAAAPPPLRAPNADAEERAPSAVPAGLHPRSPLVAVAAQLMPALDPETCAMQTLTLTSALARLKRKYQDCLVVCVHEYHPNGGPARVSVPWISLHLAETTGKGQQRVGEEAMRAFRAEVIEVVVQRAGEEEPFAVKLALGGEMKGVFFVPVVDAKTPPKWVRGWVCLLRELGDVGL